MKRGAALALLLLGGCGSHVSTGPRADEAYDNAMDTGRSAFDLAHPEQAQGEYETAYGRALLRDDAVALGDAGYNLAVTALAQDRPQQSLDMAMRTRSDLSIRGRRVSDDLAVVEAAAFYRLGRYRDAFDTARGVHAGNMALQERTMFISGLAADALGDAEGLSAALQGIGTGPKLARGSQADRDELSARLALRTGQAASAVSQALGAVDLRRDELDYRGMARALRLAASAARQDGKLDRAARYERQAQDSLSQNGASTR